MALTERPKWDLTTELAKIAVIRRIQWLLAQSDLLGEMWEEYPEIGEDDWLEISQRVQDIADRSNPTGPEFEAAYAHLMERAEH